MRRSAPRSTRRTRSSEKTRFLPRVEADRQGLDLRVVAEVEEHGHRVALKPPERLITRRGLDAKTSMVLRAIRSPILTTSVPGMGWTGTQSPTRISSAEPSRIVLPDQGDAAVVGMGERCRRCAVRHRRGAAGSGPTIRARRASRSWVRSSATTRRASPTARPLRTDALRRFRRDLEPAVEGVPPIPGTILSASDRAPSAACPPRHRVRRGSSCTRSDEAFLAVALDAVPDAVASPIST